MISSVENSFEEMENIDGSSPLIVLKKCQQYCNGIIKAPQVKQIYIKIGKLFKEEAYLILFGSARSSVHVNIDSVV